MKNNPQEYLNHLLNRSKTKETHVFGKAPRFQRNRRLQTQAKYHLPSMLEQRSCNFGYGEKSSMIGNRGFPAPGTYQITNYNLTKKSICISPTFPMSRKSINFGSYLFQIQKKSKDVPSPSRYDIKLPKSHLGGRICNNRSQTQSQLKNKKVLPGPGAYNLQRLTMANSSAFVLSNYKKSISPKYRQSKMQVKQKPKEPFVYEQFQNKFGKFTNSKFKSSSGSTFSKSKRESLIDKQKLKTPSFKYNNFSQFGQIRK